MKFCVVEYLSSITADGTKSTIFTKASSDDGMLTVAVGVGAVVGVAEGFAAEGVTKKIADEDALEPVSEESEPQDGRTNINAHKINKTPR